MKHRHADARGVAIYVGAIPILPIVGVSVLLLGVFYWFCWTKVWPKFGGYKIVAQRHEDAQGIEHVRYVKIYHKNK